MAGCCGITINDITIQTQVNTTVQMYLFELNQLYIAAAFDIDVAFPETPDDFDFDPGDVGPEVAQRNRALCLATESFVNETFNRALAYLQSQTEEVAGVIALGVAIPFVPVYAVIGAFIGVGVLAGNVVLQLANEDYRNYISCAMFDELKGKDTNNRDAFFESADNLPARPPPPENPLEAAARDLIEIWLRSQLNNLENYLGFIKTLNLAMGMAVSVTDNNCVCLTSEMEILETDPPMTVQAEIEDRGSGVWRLTSGIYIREDFGATDVIRVARVGGGCFTVSAAVLISGSLSRTGWVHCGGPAGSADSPVPQTRVAIDVYSLQDIGQTDGFVVDITVIDA